MFEVCVLTVHTIQGDSVMPGLRPGSSRMASRGLMTCKATTSKSRNPTILRAQPIRHPDTLVIKPR